MYKYKSLQAGQVAQQHVFLAKLAGFYYHNIFKLMMNQLAPVASITGDIKIYLCRVTDVTTPNRKVPYFYQGIVLLPKFNNSISSVTRDKEICQSHVILR